MNARLIFLTHADVAIDPAVPGPDWRLNDRGRARRRRFASDAALAGVTAVFSSRERKAREATEIHSGALGLRVTALHENDRSATGYLPPETFARAADAFFARPDGSVDGWERARDAQGRIVAAVRTLADVDGGTLLIVAHGAVGALLRCHLLGVPITRGEDQPPGGGGCWFGIDPQAWTATSGWSVI